MDYSKIDFTGPLAQAVAKSPQFKPSESVDREKQLKQSNEEQMRSNNLIIYNVSHYQVNPVNVMAHEYAKEYFNSCGVTGDKLLPGAGEDCRCPVFEFLRG